MKFIFKVFGLCAAALTLSCGGGGGSNTPGNQGASFSAAKYAGFYLSQCESIPAAFNMVTNTVLYGRFYQVVGQSTTAVAPLQWRIDLYDTPSCSGSAIGYVENKNTANKMTIVGQTTVNGKTVDKVVVTFGAADSSVVLKFTPSAAEIGSAIRLSLPIEIFSALEYPDLWHVEAGQLFEGALVVGPDDFPVALDTASPSAQLSTALPIPAGPCGTKSVSWQVSSTTCDAILAPRASGLIASALDSADPSTGSAQFTCSNGVWSAPTAANCTAPITCPTGSVTWSVGANSCTGAVNTLIATYVGGKERASTSSATGNIGSVYLVCNAVGVWEIEPVFQSLTSCVPAPPPTPRTTDPLQLATEKNCMACHALTTASIGPSFKRIADYYRASPPPALYLESKIKFGGLGVFGSFPMPANPQVDDIDVGILKSWILSQ